MLASIEWIMAAEGPVAACLASRACLKFRERLGPNHGRCVRTRYAPQARGDDYYHPWRLTGEAAAAAAQASLAAPRLRAGRFFYLKSTSEQEVRSCISHFTEGDDDSDNGRRRFRVGDH